jgi:hypothetical protein
MLQVCTVTSTANLEGMFAGAPGGETIFLGVLCDGARAVRGVAEEGIFAPKTWKKGANNKNDTRVRTYPQSIMFSLLRLCK